MGTILTILFVIELLVISAAIVANYINPLPHVSDKGFWGVWRKVQYFVIGSMLFTWAVGSIMV